MRRRPLTSRERALLREMQDRFPIVSRPYRAIGRRLGLPEETLLSEAGRLAARGVIRYIGPVVSGRRLGIRSTLVAARVGRRGLAAVARTVNGHPGVTHNYLREGPFNLWFTLGAPSDAALSRLLGELRARTGTAPLMDLRTVRVFKINAAFPLAPGAAAAWPSRPAARAGRARPDPLTLRVLSATIPVAPAPFRLLAERLGTGEGEIRAILRRRLADGTIRRFGAVLDHRRIGHRANALVAWRIERRMLPRAARRLAAFPAVTHCVERTPRPGWPYSLYTMVHAADRESCRRLVRRMAAAAGTADCAVLFTAAELKKTRLLGLSGPA
ncbi:MAG: hypothetical protein PHN82_06930 [bacterium]|nr:hypothetical protein [bacterium]